VKASELGRIPKLLQLRWRAEVLRRSPPGQHCRRTRLVRGVLDWA
jgi:hypothetical protein